MECPLLIYIFSKFTRLIGHTNSITDVTFSHSGNLIASSSVDCTVRLWSTLSNFRESSALRGHLKIVRSVDFSPDDSHIVTGNHLFFIFFLLTIGHLYKTPKFKIT